MIKGWITPAELEEMSKGFERHVMTAQDMYDLEPDLSIGQAKYIKSLMRQAGVQKLGELNVSNLMVKTSNNRLSMGMAKRVIEKLKIEIIKKIRKEKNLD